ncbi:pseudouridine synthase family protein [Shewanella fidelis]|uniref:RluA family pseudouridine synthase n=1 Tax=Shewanella fidelis TaxID=173509 RepID=A0AAW8NKS5_9GAMM|nr:RluA family pseudouridine synthase [Shewanella fidelis]MDR8523302.1 RluA family pseudouridine synthase [Shewanella fidelis]MDW4811372.1 RluA family pseudouridine synthase [Shewanella fidelis]MDW4815493.1 RluA family pseudouridine synthase [Shewanella fidelis]MDW4819583.1 RluA family pseudouridine synthase [Shewanella fidelis]MDW4824443.1 RluA family pseudouridine synthase [Shewanella fidelis]
MSPLKIETHIKVQSAELDAASLLAEDTGLSKQNIKQAMQKGAVWHSHGKQTNRLRRAKKPLKAGDELHLYYNQAVLDEVVTAPELLFDQGQYSIWYKPFGVRCQGSKWSDHTTINRFAETHLDPARSAYIIHRLDLAASGLIVLGHSKKVTAAIAHLFETRALNKFYQVIVEGKFPEGNITIDTDVDNKSALSHAHILEYNSELNQSKVQVKIESGRKHQIRIHMASLGHPVVGDRQHGNGSENTPNLQLTSCHLSFVCPLSGEHKVFELPQHYRPEFQLK